MDILQQTLKICKLYDIKPVRSKGQNFLINDKVYDKIIEAADLKKSEVVLEVGPGLGFLTAKLAKKTKKVIAVELDDKLAEILKKGIISEGVENVMILNGNILDLRFINCDLRNLKYKIVANLPYNITSVFLRKVLSGDIKPISLILMLQKEVAERIAAKPGKMSLLAVSVQYFAKPEIIQIVPAQDFWPAPEVESAIIKLEVRSKKLEVDEKSFFRLVKFGFCSRRKMLKNNLAGGFHVSQSTAEALIIKAGFDSKIRAQELPVNDWLKLFGEFHEFMV